MTDFDNALDELAAVQQTVVDALRRAAELGAELELPEVATFEGTPTEVLVQQMLAAASERAAEDRKQVALLLVLVERLQVSVDAGAAAAATVASDLAAAQGRADAVDGAPGEAADAGLKSG